MSRSRVAIATLGLAVVVWLVASSVLGDERARDAAPVAAAAQPTSAPAEPARAPLARPAAPSRETVPAPRELAAASEPGAESDSVDAPAAEEPSGASLGGVALLEDGYPLADVRLVLSREGTKSEDARPSVEGAPGPSSRAEVTTDAHGVFRVDGLWPGVYAFGQRTHVGLGSSSDRIETGVFTGRVVFPGHLLHLRCVRGDGTPGRELFTAVRYMIRTAGTDEYFTTSETSTSTNEHGEVVVAFREPGVAKVSILDETEAAYGHEVVLEGRGGYREEVISLRPREFASLRVEVVDTLGARIDDYRLRFSDPSGNVSSFTRTSQEARSGEWFDRIPPGSYDLSLAPSFTFPLPFYRGGSAPRVELQPGGVEHVQVVVLLGGRLELVNETDEPIPESDGIWMRFATDDSAWERVQTARQTPEGGVTVSNQLPPRSSGTAFNAIDGGSYLLRVGPDTRPEYPFEILPGRVTRVLVGTDSVIALTPE